MFPFVVPVSVSSDHWYFEMELNDVAKSNAPGAGIAISAAGLSSYCGSDNFGWGARFDTSLNAYRTFHGGSAVGTLAGPAVGASDILGVAWDTAGNLYFSVNNLFGGGVGTSTPVTPDFTGVVGTLFPMFSIRDASTLTFLALASASLVHLPSGYAAWGGSPNNADKDASITDDGSNEYTGGGSSIASIRGDTPHSS